MEDTGGLHAYFSLEQRLAYEAHLAGVKEPTQASTETSRAIHTYDRISFLRCRRRWDLESPLRKGLAPKGGEAQLAPWFGSGIHFALEDLHGWKRFSSAAEALEAYYKSFPEAERPIDSEATLQLAKDMLAYYQVWLQDKDDYRTLWYDGQPQVEVKFQIPIPELNSDLTQAPKIFAEGTFDRVVLDAYGRVWLMDYKTAKIFDTNKLETDLQISTYLWAAEQWYRPLRRVDQKAKVPVEGMIYLQMKKEAPAEPRVLKNGGFSTDKRQRTTYKLYYKALMERFKNHRNIPSFYGEVLEGLLGEESPEGDRYIRWDQVLRNPTFRQSVYQHLVAQAREMLNPNVAIYPSPTRDCIWDCPFRVACIAMDDGSDWEYMLGGELEKRRDPRDWRKRIVFPTA